ncbi:UDP-glucuronosyltransferase [Seminavis robusta]|uniref:UDP-glucuronosyltransferase n=1 Tax=Seminavis robusta TaxID=568900 RepID=A0A9N8HWT9_9STRA|nr:UDP-glucuronosyltransferase [Seminavis robusta]|eukprot:Sro2041_g312260.1 UDP-glucuronosyltransferase (630) ;mRNA; r:12087-13976
MPSLTMAREKATILVESHDLYYGGCSSSSDHGANCAIRKNATAFDSSSSSEIVVDLPATTIETDPAVWPKSKPLPPLKPSAKKVLFVAHFFVSTDVNHMLLMAEELRDRGHECHFIVMEPYVKRVEKAGFTATGTPNVLQGAGLDTIQRAFSYASHETSWFTYVYKYIYGIAPLAAEYYEPSMTIVEQYLAKHGKPDLMVASKASECAIDVAWHEGIPLSVLFTMPLGGMLNAYEDVVAAPDANLWGGVKEQSSLYMRLRKKMVRSAMLINPVVLVGSMKLAWDRYNHGYYPFAIPGQYWKESLIISPWSMGIDLARPLRPLTQLVGFMTPPLPELPHDDASLAKFSTEDQEHLRFLNSKTDGVVFCAFGSLAVLTQEWFDELVAGMDLWARTQGPNSGAVIAVNDLSLKSGLNVSKVPDTVQVTGWINQKLFLAHPHTQAFITHGGLGSLGESIEARVPMLVFPLFFDQPNNAHRLEEAGVALKLHFREERVTAATVAARLTKLTSDPSFAHNLERQYQINKRSGGVAKAIDLIEDALLWDGNLSHLIPVTERATFFQRTNLDLYLLIVLLAAAFLMTVVWPIAQPLLQRYRITARLEAMANKTFEEVISHSSSSGSLHEQLSVISNS